MKKFTFLFLICLIFSLSLSACSKKEEDIKIKKKTIPIVVEKDAPAVTEKSMEEIGEIEDEKSVTVVPESNPEEAADFCLDALYKGDVVTARKYVDPDSSANSELKTFRKRIMAQFGAAEDEALREKADVLVDCALKKFRWVRTGITKKGSSATVTYEISFPDIVNINYSKYSSDYMAAAGLTPEAIMKQIEGMSEKESELWSKGYTMDVTTYALKHETNFSYITKKTTVTLVKNNGGWLVIAIKNSDK